MIEDKHSGNIGCSICFSTRYSITVQKTCLSVHRCRVPQRDVPRSFPTAVEIVTRSSVTRGQLSFCI